MYSKKIIIDGSQVNHHFELNISSVFKIFQDIALEHGEQICIGKPYSYDKGLFWVITRYSLSLYKMPKYNEEIIVKTYPGKNMKFLFPRYFQIETLTGEVLIKASTMWVVLNSNDHKVCLNPFPGFIPPSETLLDEEKQAEKINLESNKLKIVGERVVRYSDIDLNAHLNHSRYIDFLLDTHDLEFFESNRISHICVNYNHEVKCGEKITISKYDIENGEIIAGFNNNENVIAAKISYTKR